MITRLPIDFVTFGGGRSIYRGSAERLAREAARSGWFRRVSVITDRSLPPEFYRAHGDFVRANPRGFGYWIWKPFLLERMLRDTTPGLVLYCDAGHVLNLGDRSRATFTEYVETTESRDLLLFEIDFVEAHWCKKDTLGRLDPTGTFGQTKARESGTVFLKRGPAAHDIVAEWLAVACEDSYHHLDDTPSIVAEDDDFREHRHDQSILSLIMKRREIAPATDSLNYVDEPRMTSVPIWTLRHRSRLTFRPRRPAPYQLARKVERAVDKLERHVRESRRTDRADRNPA